MNAILFSLILPVVIALLNIGSTEALGIIFSIYNSALLASYIITISSVLLHRLRGGKLPDAQARYTLGKWGILVNSVALIYMFPIWVFSFFPSAPNPTPQTMNWAVLLVGGIVVLATAYYIAWGSKQYTPPDETAEDIIERYQTTMSMSEKEVSGGIAVESVEAGKRD